MSRLPPLQIIRMPLTFLPLVLAATTDALVAIRRISNFLRAEELAVPYTIDPSSNVALDVDGDFTWEEVRKGGTATKFDKKGGKDGKDKATKENRKGKDKKGDAVLPTTADPEPEQEKEKAEERKEKPFELKDLRLQVPKGAFVAVVGRVGSGKSSLLQALIGEMRKTRGEVRASWSFSFPRLVY